MQKGDKQITLEFTNYKIEGIAQLTLWGGGAGTIGMKPYFIDTLSDEEIKKHANDNGFGCQSIDEIEVDIYENYEGYCVYLESKSFKL